MNTLLSFLYPFHSNTLKCMSLSYLLLPIIKNIQLNFIYDTNLYSEILMRQIGSMEVLGNTVFNPINVSSKNLLLYYWLKELTESDLIILSTYIYIKKNLTPYDPHTHFNMNRMLSSEINTTPDYTRKLYSKYTKLLNK